MKILISTFILVALAQLYVPAKMIIDREILLNSGQELKIKAAPIDPYDPFRGKYITLSYEESNRTFQTTEKWKHGETVYVQFKSDPQGYAVIKSISKQKPNTSNYLKTEVSNTHGNKVVIHYPFNRFYMEESKAYEAEMAYNESLSNSNSETYALVSIKDGEAVLKNVLIDGVQIRDVVLNERAYEEPERQRAAH